MLVNNIGVDVYQIIAVGPDTVVIIVYDGYDAGYPFAASVCQELRGVALTCGGFYSGGLCDVEVGET